MAESNGRAGHTFRGGRFIQLGAQAKMKNTNAWGGGGASISRCSYWPVFLPSQRSWNLPCHCSRRTLTLPSATDDTCSVPAIQSDTTETESETWLRQVASILQKKSKRIYGSAEAMSQECGKSVRHVVRTLHALAEASAREQTDLLKSVLSYASLSKDGSLRPQLYLQHVRHDETQTVLVGKYSGGQAHAHRGKVHVIQRSWVVCLVPEERELGSLEPRKKTVLLSGTFSPVLALSENATGETIAWVLQQTSPIGSLDLSVFSRRVTVMETDACPANLRAQAILHDPSMPSLSTVCAAHKVHTVASKCWESYKELHAGVVKTLKVLRSPGMFPKFLDQLLLLVDGVEVIHSQSLSDDALAYRKHILAVFAPNMSEKPKCAATILGITQCVYNGDWRVPTLQHYCSGTACCQDRQETIAKMKATMPRLVKSLRLTSFNDGDWASWHKSLRLMGFWSSFHGSFKPALLGALQPIARRAAPMQNPSLAAEGGQDTGRSEAEKEGVCKGCKDIL